MPLCWGLHCSLDPTAHLLENYTCLWTTPHSILLMTFLILSCISSESINGSLVPTTSQVSVLPHSQTCLFPGLPADCSPLIPATSGPAHSLLPGLAPLFASSMFSTTLVSLITTDAFLPGPYLNQFHPHPPDPSSSPCSPPTLPSKSPPIHSIFPDSNSISRLRQHHCVWHLCSKAPGTPAQTPPSSLSHSDGLKMPLPFSGFLPFSVNKKIQQVSPMSPSYHHILTLTYSACT